MLLLILIGLCILVIIALSKIEENTHYKCPGTKIKPTDYGTSWYRNRLKHGAGLNDGPPPSAGGYTSEAWSLIEMRRMNEHREHMSELRRQTDAINHQTQMMRASGPVEGGLIDTIWKGKW